MHVGLNLVFLVPGETGGMEVYARELVRELTDRGDMRLTLFVNRELAQGGDELIAGNAHVIVPVEARNRVGWVRGEQQLLPGLAARAGVSLVHSLASTGPAWGRFRRVVTIHDLNYRIVPEAHAGVRGLGMRVLVPLAARRSHRVIVDSANTGADVHRLLRVPTDRIDVVPLGMGARPDVRPVPELELRARLEAGGRPVVLSASAKRPHKNLARLLSALAELPAERRPVLVLPGYPTTHERELKAHAAELGLDADVRFLGWVDAATLEGLYRLASCVVFPSLYEGFGLPVLEAMARGVPVATSNRSSLPEVAGDAAILFDPLDVGAIREAIQRLLGDSAERERLRTAGVARAAAFTWARTAELTAAGYARALAGAARKR